MSNPTSEQKYFHYVERAPLWLTISALTIVAGIAAMVINHSQTGSAFKLGLAFTGGQSLLLRFKQELPLDGQAVKTIVEKYAEGDAIVQVYANDPHEVSIKLRIKTAGKSEQANAAEANRLVVDLKKDLGNAYGEYSPQDSASPNPITLDGSFVGPTVGAELIRNAILALVWGSLIIMIYILFRFGSWPYSLAGIIAMIHDVQITLTVTAILRLEVSESFIAVFLTIVGYSINDTIIIFDRIRENLRLHGGRMDFKQLCNISLNQTVVRSINTVITVVIMIVAMLVVGGANLRDFLIAMLVGMISGAYSSIFVATPLMLYFSKGRAPQSPAMATPGGTTFLAPPREAAPPALTPSEDGESPAEAARRAAARAARRQRRR